MSTKLKSNIHSISDAHNYQTWKSLLFLLNVEEVAEMIKLPSEDFLNTQTKRSIIIKCYAF